MTAATDTTIRIVEVTSARDRRDFIRFPHLLYRDDPHWVPPLDSEIRKLLDRRHNPFFDHGEACLWLAWRGGEIVGRISAQINRLHLDLHHDDTGNFGFLEAVDDQSVFHALLAVAEGWLKARGMTRILGPYSPSMNDEIGVLVDGFDTPPMLMMPHSFPYYDARLAAQGYAKAKDLHAFLLDMAKSIDIDAERVQKAIGKLRTRLAITTRKLDMKRFADDMRRGLAVYNDAWTDNWSFLPVTEREAEVMIASIKQIVDPESVVFGLVDGEMASIVAGVPNLNEIIADFGGRLLPFNWAKLLWRLKWRRPRSVRVILAGVRSAYRHSPASSGLIVSSWYALLQHFKRAGIDKVEMSWVLEDNHKTAASIRTLGAEIYKTYRLYAKPLA